MSPFNKHAKRLAKKLPLIRDLIAERDRLRTENIAFRNEIEDLKRRQGFVPPGHFYSPIPDLDELHRVGGEFIDRVPVLMAGAGSFTATNSPSGMDRPMSCWNRWILSPAWLH